MRHPIFLILLNIDLSCHNLRTIFPFHLVLTMRLERIVYLLPLYFFGFRFFY